MEINKVKLIGKIPEGLEDEYLQSFDCEIYFNDSSQPAGNIKRIEIVGDAFAVREGNPGVYVNELEIELEKVKVEIEESGEEAIKSRLGHRMPLI